ncbi:hypothetical protein KFL_004930020 [Klebsormidium nitens]|uniref:Uncharacterized protein n=1 Tax=Klebsormidium nitens TaxID=105231 RepID=A0A1Y1IDY1_KLENI|nr:hypothetical protein KFL_004930020 [Klebsormidium nitens]|eukprot:GAQ89164.1 hypothetical protein KFL_004930020 [Klebsormidium nitens]
MAAVGQQVVQRGMGARGRFKGEGKGKEPQKRKRTEAGGASGSAAEGGSLEQGAAKLKAGEWTRVKEADDYDVKDVFSKVLHGLEYPAYVSRELHEETGVPFYYAEAPDIRDLCTMRPNAREAQDVLARHLHAELAERAIIRMLPPLPSPDLPPNSVKPTYTWKIRIDGERLTRLLNSIDIGHVEATDSD